MSEATAPSLLRTARIDDVAACLRAVERDDAAAVPVLDERDKAALAEAAAKLTYKRAKPQVNEGEKAVYQDFWLTRDIPAGSVLEHCRDAVEALVNAALRRLDPAPCPPVTFHETVAQWYEPTTCGISPHRDPKTFRYLVALLVMRGDGDFYIVDDRRGSNPRHIPAPEGSLLLMRQPGFGAEDRHPFHTLRTVYSDRLILTFRHDSRRDA
ncbi:hypothetical protein SAMN05216241_108126 [Limimonas halophila]|uniref:Fe2OG dioxygenase domain-containing protein n=1 Tax=Limimonas halophila TaxID=1082479 RepID=A0A1G7T756_9PROT|nr:alpha-ketoglutarate-dependent dioxygenase AlkB [Limimonas halophila]SDG31153.1 hypothetical protein SAMN05216241_108126 [Limimonas halophila]